MHFQHTMVQATLMDTDLTRAHVIATATMAIIKDSVLSGPHLQLTVYVAYHPVIQSTRMSIPMRRNC